MRTKQKVRTTGFGVSIAVTGFAKAGDIFRIEKQGSNIVLIPEKERQNQQLSTAPVTGQGSALIMTQETIFAQGE